MTSVIINGALGNMGKAAIKAVTHDTSLKFVAGLDIDDNLEQALLENPGCVVVDLTHPSAVFNNVKTILNHSCHAVVGTTGLSAEQLSECGALASKQNRALIVCPNFAISALLMMKFSQEAAAFMERCEIIEYHHDKKADAPSGTAIKTAELITEVTPDINNKPIHEKELIPGSRGGKKNQIPIHSIRIPGIVANQEVLFGAQGQSLSIRHDTISRDAFMPGLLLAIKATASHLGLVYGLEHILFNTPSSTRS